MRWYLVRVVVGWVYNSKGLALFFSLGVYHKRKGKGVQKNRETGGGGRKRRDDERDSAFP